MEEQKAQEHERIWTRYGNGTRTEYIRKDIADAAIAEERERVWKRAIDVVNTAPLPVVDSSDVAAILALQAAAGALEAARKGEGEANHA